MEANSGLDALDEREVPSGWWNADDPVFQVDLDVLREFTERLRALNYLSIQYFPIKFSWGALTSEYKNLGNVLRPRWHRLFHSSLFPSLYVGRLGRQGEALSVCFDALFLNRSVRPESLTKHFGQELMDRALDSHFMREENGLLSAGFSFVPFGDYILLRDRYEMYQNNDVRNRRYRVVLGADALPFTEFLRFYFAGRRFDRALEVGSGSGIQMLVASEACDHCLAVDYNERAVRFTEINSALHGRHNIEARFSDLYSNVDGEFDVILANPWFCELRTGGLEEVPGITEGLRSHLREDGVCLIALNSYVQGRSNPVLTFLKDFAVREKYDVELFTTGYGGLESGEQLKGWRRHGITHTTSYNAVLQKRGRGIVRVHDIRWLRKLVQFGKIMTYRVRHRL